MAITQRRARSVRLFIAAAAVLTVGQLPTTAQAAPTEDAGEPCIAVIVDSGVTDPTGACVAFEPGMTGQDVLEEAGFELSFDDSGLICQINSYPDSCQSDSTHFWSYYHRPPGAAADGWEFSMEGPAQYTAPAGSTEGWAFQNGNERTPEALDYSSLASEATEQTPQGGRADEDDSEGRPWGVLIGAVAVIGLAAGLGWIAYRRKRS